MSQAYDGGKPTKNPSVEIWLKYYDKDLYEAINDQGILPQLRPKKDGVMSFLYPAEKSYRDKIISKLNGDEASLGVNMVQALIVVRLNLQEPSDWLDMKDNIPNGLGQKIELSPASTNKQVVLANGVNLAVNKDFAARDKNITVWDYKGTTDMPLNGKPAEFVKNPPRSSRKSGGPKRGGNGMLTVPDKCMLARRLEDQALCLMKKGSSEFETNNPFTSAMVSFAQYLDAKKAPCLDTFKSMCEPNSVAAFYAILLPYTPKSILESEVKEWLENTRAICLLSNPNEFWVKYVTGLGDIGQKHADELEDQKSRISSLTALTTGKKLYSDHYKEHADLRLKGDELRFLINTTMASGLVETDMSQMFLDIKIMYSPESTKDVFLVPDARTDPVFGSTGLMFVSSRCFMSAPNPDTKNLKTISFQEAVTGNGSIDPDEVLITDDAKYLAQTESKGGDFVSSLKALLSSMPPAMKATLLADISG